MAPKKNKIRLKSSSSQYTKSMKMKTISMLKTKRRLSLEVAFARVRTVPQRKAISELNQIAQGLNLQK